MAPLASQGPGSWSPPFSITWPQDSDPGEIAKSYPTVSREAVRAALLYAAELAKERVLPLGG